ncbi:nucleotide-binding domain-containing protein [Flavobacterium johnsoniae]|uniref:Adenylyl/Guanylyl and SMODS C-terminal sensor domain-containing protein n=1 Tax=Flavobacterium johnsoniae (strain ATCC 17061 / DSM 2064 / JCM 8514 / BCRC 14874 / CCUG 350202 / NBRC 14942 / NCIMB 11054 / UW101) TaxID=376686 RepID=A5FIV5_FLAJ1|nr:hypothetical protein [Flavobacterium johnsoniae]ABQ04864.1 hypothetical protein Fjoh_1832 [Flavobacterium johnsoniae UW101]OXG02937.1 hypothetical protein B0A63_01390 [Flavobacterium johnsoniae UW101]WQG83337.1 hypothetical protein SR927_09530 [Flavobacterium johnsoniae UW101]SHK36936.1 hypothetical protein SAMN05444146_1283 [Flavobacterium johnsoniae]
MKKDKISSLIRTYVREKLSPTMSDIQFVSKIYQSFNDLLGVNNCIQIGSYPRYTAIRPLHDLDILYILGDWQSSNIEPFSDLNNLADKFEKEYKNPTKYNIEITVQTHSISFRYLDDKIEVFAVDLVPALKKDQNEFKKDMFYVPEIIKQNRGQKRQEYYRTKQLNNSKIIWIKTDPLGYIEVATSLNQINEDFRKSVKFVKGWKHNCKEKNDDFKLKSFHLEQLITRDYLINPYQDIFESIFTFFTSLKKNIEQPNIPDRANANKCIDEYLSELSENQYKIINEAIDAILIALENIDLNPCIRSIIDSGFYKRKSETETYLFDQKIPILIDSSLKLDIDGFVEKFDGFRKFKANLKLANGIVDNKNSIEFKVIQNTTNAEILKWKVKNDNNSPEPRGEITDHNTYQKVETTAYLGSHYVDCFAVKNNICIARDRVNVIVKN